MYYAISQPGQVAPGLASQLMGLGALYVITTESSENLGEDGPGHGANSAAIAYGAPSSVPEPSRVAGLLGLAGMGFIGLVWRRRRTAA